MLYCTEASVKDLTVLLAKYDLILEKIVDNKKIPGSFWGDKEAGIIQNRVFYRSDTPVHSVLHEACHSICMDQHRRSKLHTDANGDYDEENGVCYLQILLSNYLYCTNSQKLMQDMDEWGYSFRLGTTKQWFQEDAEDARQWLIKHRIIDNDNQPLWQNRIS